MISFVIGALFAGGAIILCFFPNKLRGIVPDWLLPAEDSPQSASDSGFDPIYTSFVLIVHFGRDAAELVAQLDWNFVPNDADRVAGMMQSMLFHEGQIIACTNYGNVTPSFLKVKRFFEDEDADLSSTFVSATEADGDVLSAPECFSQTENVVLCLNMIYEGEVPALEQDLDDVAKLTTALSTIYSLSKNGRILSANIYKLPAHPHHKLTNDQVLMNFPALKPV